MPDQAFHKRTDDKPFFVVDGKKIHSLSELYSILSHMDSASFLHHVSDGKNDFALWISNVFSEYQLADEISRLQTKEDMQRALRDWFEHHLKKEYQNRKKDVAKSTLPREEVLQSSELSSMKEHKKIELKPQDASSQTHSRDFLSRAIDLLIGIIIGAAFMYFFL